MARKKNEVTECPLCESKTVISWSEIRLHYKCPGCGLYWTEKKSDHIPDTKKKDVNEIYFVNIFNHYVDTTETIEVHK